MKGGEAGEHAPSVEVCESVERGRSRFEGDSVSLGYDQHPKGVHPHFRCCGVSRALIRVVPEGSAMPISNSSMPSVPDGLHVEDLTQDGTALLITARTTAAQASCRVCGRASMRVHIRAEPRGSALGLG